MSAGARLFGWLADRWIQLLFIAVGVVAIVGGTVWYVAERQAQAAADGWSSVPGTVVASRVDWSPGPRRTSRSDRSGQSGYSAHIIYSYEVRGRGYRSDNIWLMTSEGFGNRADAEAFLEPYQPGATVTVYYDPADPSNAALIVARPAWPILVLAATGLIFIAIGWFFLRF